MGRDTRELRESAESILKSGIKNQDTFKAALDGLRQLTENIAFVDKMVKETKSVIAKLNESCGDYIKKHPSFLGDTAQYDEQMKLVSGDYAYDNYIAHFALTHSKYKRTENQQLTQEFLGKLPVEWVKSKKFLDDGSIAKLLKDTETRDATQESLKDYCLKRDELSTWSWSLTSIAEEQAISA